ncbi:ATP-binding protein [Solirubrobacter taibaiensis]|nr:ATP-binding protein [Solirubrobacter taibaiensis]
MFELDIALPDARLDAIATDLVGFDRRFERVGRSLQALLDPDSVGAWAKRFHEADAPVIRLMADRYPLVVLAGDVGTGKTAFAECAADRLVRLTRREGQLMKLSTRVRGTGHVGQMSHLINEAFTVVEQQAGKRRLAFLVIDEADSLGASRDAIHHHHEDKVAVNTLIQKIDDTRRLGGRVLVFLATNRAAALDPALLRRAGIQERFDRPDEEQRLALLRHDTQGFEIDGAVLDEVVDLTGPERNEGLGFTFSDLRTRLIPEALLRAFPDRPMTGDDLLAIATCMRPSPALIDAVQA